MKLWKSGQMALTWAYTARPDLWPPGSFAVVGGRIGANKGMLRDDLKHAARQAAKLAAPGVAEAAMAAGRVVFFPDNPVVDWTPEDSRA